MSVENLIYRWFTYQHPLNNRFYLVYVLGSASSPSSSAVLCLILDNSFAFVDVRWCRVDHGRVYTSLASFTDSDEISQDSSLLPPSDVVNYYIRKHRVCA